MSDRVGKTNLSPAEGNKDEKCPKCGVVKKQSEFEAVLKQRDVMVSFGKTNLSPAEGGNTGLIVPVTIADVGFRCQNCGNEWGFEMEYYSNKESIRNESKDKE